MLLADYRQFLPITANTPMRISGPCAGHPIMRTAADGQGIQVLGTLNNCASSMTPWGTYLSGEENWANYFAAGDKPSAHHKRWGLKAKSYTQWEKHDARFNAELHPNEPNRFGWIVEVDPMDPTSTPIKRTALGRAAHEGQALKGLRLVERPQRQGLQILPEHVEGVPAVCAGPSQ
jgi:secreted PhoX family phosphatase